MRALLTVSEVSLYCKCIGHLLIKYAWCSESMTSESGVPLDQESFHLIEFHSLVDQ